MLGVKIRKVGLDFECQAKAFEFYSVGNGKLLKVYKHGINMIRFIFYRVDCWQSRWGERLKSLIFTYQIFFEYLPCAGHLLEAEGTTLSQ